MTVANQPHSLFTAPSVFLPPTVVTSQQALPIMPPPMIPEEDTLEVVLLDHQKWAKIESGLYHSHVDLTASPLFQILKKVCAEEQSPELFKVDLIDLKAPQATHDPHEVLKIYHQVMLQPESAVAAEDVLPPLPSEAEARDEEMREEPQVGDPVQQDAV